MFSSFRAYVALRVCTCEWECVYHFVYHWTYDAIEFKLKLRERPCVDDETIHGFLMSYIKKMEKKLRMGKEYM